MLQPSVVVAATFLVTLVCCLALVLTTRWHGRFSLDTTVGLQKFHSSPTPRIGGLATLAGLVAGYAVASEHVRQLLGPLLVASLPAFGVGLLEDVTKKVGVRARLLGTIFSGFVAWYLTGAALTRTGVPGLDDLLAFAPVAILFTAVAIGGVANAVNIIDGFNGLAGGVLSIMFVALGVIAAGAGDPALAGTCWTLAACSVGFTLVNWPFGKIFLGDGGAYQFGFAVAWIAVLLVYRNPDVPAWAPLTVCAYPVLEVAFSVVRKSRRAGYHPGQPDRVHLHMLVHRRVVRAWLPGIPQTWQNGLTSPFAWLYAGLLGVWGVVFARDKAYLMTGLVAAALAYASIYTRLTRFRWWTVTARTRPPARARADDRPATHLKASAGHLTALMPFGSQPPRRRPGAIQWPPQPAPRQSHAMQASRWAVVGYGVLGLSTCLTLIEPAPFELIAIPLVLASWVQHLLSRSRAYTPSSAALVFLLALFSLLQLLPVGTARNLLQATQYAAITVLLILIGIHLGRLFGTGDVRFRAFARGYCLAALLSAAVAMGSLYFAETRNVPEWLLFAGRPKAFFKDPNVLGPYLVPAVLAFLYKAAQARRLAKPIFVGCALLCALGVIATASRGAWVNLAVAVAVYALLARNRMTIFTATACCALAVVAAMGIFSESAPDLFELFSGRTQLQDYDADRFLTAREAWELGLRYPLGVGPGAIIGYTGFDAMAPHNTYARIWAENGPAALILFVLIVVAAWACAFQAWLRVRATAGSALAVVLALLMGVLVNAAVIDALHWRHFWVLLCLCIFSSHAWRRA